MRRLFSRRQGTHAQSGRGRCAYVAIALACCVGVSAQRPSVVPTRWTAEQRPRIDGRLDDPAWQSAAVLSRLTQVEPVEGAPPEVATEVRLAYDDDALYIAMRCEEQPGLVRGRLMTRDANLDPDDRIELWIDPFNTQRFAYWFQIGAGGSRGDALLGDGGRGFNKRWDGIWYGRSQITATGWQAEIALPFKTMAFDPEAAAWGFNLVRQRAAAGTQQRWASPLQAYWSFDLTIGGELRGMHGMRQGIGLDVVPYAKVALSRDRQVSKHTQRTGDFGVDLRYRLTPSLSMLLTYNTDFAETEVDERQVNLTRFPLFFPEKRAFFLQDSNLFQFGASSGFRGTTRVLPFFSRRIGRDASGNPVPLIAGAKLAGRAGDWNIGALGAIVDETALDPEKGMGVVRVARNVGDESSIGVIATGGRPEGAGDAVTAGTDFRLADNRFFGEGHSASLSGYWLASQNEGSDDDGQAWGLQLGTRSRSWNHELEIDSVDRGFDPKLGFVRRRGVRRVAGDVEYTWRSEDQSAVREVEISLDPELTTTSAGEKDSYEFSAGLRVQLRSLDRLSWTSSREFERVPESFELRPGIAVPPGDYTVTRHRLRLSSSDHRAVAGSASAEVGDFFTGNLLRIGSELQWFASRHWRAAVTHDVFQVRLDSGRFTTRVSQGRLDLDFSPDLSWRNLVQYDTASRDLTLQSRVRWTLEPGRDLFVLGVFGWNRTAHAAPLIPTNQDVTVKVGYTVRF